VRGNEREDRITFPVGSSFFLLFSLSAVVTGFIVNRVQTRWVLLVMSLVWALTQFPMVGTVGFATVLACRIALGAGEGPAYPVALHATYKWFPNELRTLPTAIVAQGAGVGLMVALPVLNWVIINYSWHWAFAALGIVGLTWTGAWLLLGREGSIVGSAASTATATPDRISYARLLRSPTVLSSWCAFFGAYWGLSLAIAWQTAFLIKGLGFAQGSIGLLSALPPSVSVVLMIAAGWYSQHLLAHGVSSRMARGVFGGACVGLGGIALLIMPHMPTIPLKIAMTTIGISLPSVIYVFSHAVVSEVTPVAQRGALLSIGNAVGTSAGLLAPYIMGSVIETAATPLDGFQHRLRHLWDRHADRRHYRFGADAPRAGCDAVGARNARASRDWVCLKKRAAFVPVMVFSRRCLAAPTSVLRQQRFESMRAHDRHNVGRSSSFIGLTGGDFAVVKRLP
jgi:MFS family permease